MNNRKSFLCDVLNLDLETLKGLLAGMQYSDSLQSPEFEQLAAAQYVLEGISGKLDAIHKMYGFEVNTNLFEHQAHEFEWQIILPESENQQ